MIICGLNGQFYIVFISFSKFPALKVYHKEKSNKTYFRVLSYTTSFVISKCTHIRVLLDDFQIMVPILLMLTGGCFFTLGTVLSTLRPLPHLIPNNPLSQTVPSSALEEEGRLKDSSKCSQFLSHATEFSPRSFRPPNMVFIFGQAAPSFSGKIHFRNIFVASVEYSRGHLRIRPQPLHLCVD